MGLKVNINSIIILFLLIVYPPPVFASWSLSQELITGTWGNGNSQFGIFEGDTSDFLPIFNVTIDQKVVIRDGINERMKVYDHSGSLIMIIPYRMGLHYSELTIADTYGYSGDFVGYKNNGSIFYRPDQKKYVLFSPTGQLLETYTERPLELGKVRNDRNWKNLYDITVTYPDHTYHIVADQPMIKHYRDNKKFLYRINRYVAGSRNSPINAYRVYMYNTCGREVSVLNMPLSEYEPMPLEYLEAPAWKDVPIIEYGEPIVSINGDVYCWARTKTEYKILKWTWQNDPNDPVDGPDSPEGLTAASQPSGIKLTWTASPQDPGCVTGYEIARSETTGGSYSVVGSVDKGVLEYTDTTAIVGTAYFYTVRAKNDSDYSSYSNEATATRQ